MTTKFFLVAIILFLFQQCKVQKSQKETFLNYLPEMVYVQGGTFTMGSNDGGDDEKPAHSVTLSNFYIGKYEVTQAQWKAVMGENSKFFTNDNLPVDFLSWVDVQKYIQKLNQKTGKKYRLPTEAEWEYAARGGQRSRGYKYAGSNSLDSVAWYGDNCGGTRFVGSKSANELSIYDMSGNVWEWCSDWHDRYSPTARTNPKGANSGSARILRGGSWNDSAAYCCVTYRSYCSPSYRDFFNGFRLVLDH